MPIYEYSCEDCQHIFEEWQKDFSDKEMNCPVCGGHAKRMISNTAFILKGSGWYVTDYARDSKASTGNGGNGNGDGKKSEAESTSSEASTSKDTSSSTTSQPSQESKSSTKNSTTQST